ncbi:hypothetical protein GCM10010244_80120 [Streptomyces coeruleorubidus]|nr:hypothetical protein GCM10010244_80120 [Streptomyces bellus]
MNCLRSWVQHRLPARSERRTKFREGVITQCLFYLAWLMDHRAEFEYLVRGPARVTAASQVLWSGPRLICIAGDFTRYDVHAVREHPRSIDLVRYRLFGSELLGLETVASVSGGMQVSTRFCSVSGTA